MSAFSGDYTEKTELLTIKPTELLPEEVQEMHFRGSQKNQSMAWVITYWLKIALDQIMWNYPSLLLKRTYLDFFIQLGISFQGLSFKHI